MAKRPACVLLLTIVAALAFPAHADKAGKLRRQLDEMLGPNWSRDMAMDYLQSLRGAEQHYDEVARRPERTEEHKQDLTGALYGLASQRATAGDYPGAMQAFSEVRLLYPEKAGASLASDTAVNAEFVKSLLAEYSPEPAVAAIVRAARDRQIVILTEAPFAARHRVLATQLMLELRKLGFSYLAVEALEPEPEDFAKRAFPSVEDGDLIKEPLFGDLVRQAKRAGYRFVSYEKSPRSYSKDDGWANGMAAEDAQARSLVDSILKRDRKARVLVYVSFAHGYKGFEVLPDGRHYESMAERLRVRTGIDPLCVDQINVFDPMPYSRDRELLDAIFADRADESVVLASKQSPAGHWVFDRSRVDLQVLHRPTYLVDGRPHWMSMEGYRKPQAIPLEIPRLLTRPLLVQAFADAEPDYAVPVDQMFVEYGKTPPVFMLPEGNYRFVYQ
jgi:hypothetical protein